MGQCIHNGSADTEASERTGTRHKSDFCDVLPGGVVHGEFVFDKKEKAFGEVAPRVPSVFGVIQSKNSGGSGGVEVEFHLMVTSLKPSSV